MNDGSSWPTELDACQRLIRELSSEREQLSSRLQAQDAQLDQQARELESREFLVQEQSCTVVDLEASHQQLSQENEELKLTIRKLMDRLYGRRRERFVADPHQIQLDFGDDAAAAAEALAEAVWEAERTIEEVQSKRRAKRRKERVRSEKFPEHLPRYEKIVDLPEEQKAGKTFIGYDEVETLEFERARLRVRVTKYAKYAKSEQPHEGVESPERPTGLVEGNRFDTSVAVEIIASRFFYHLPYYRQQDVFAGCGWTPSRSTLLNIVAASEFVLQPLVQYYHDLLGKVDALGCDETPVTLIVPPQLPELDPQDPRSRRMLEVLSKAQAKGRPSVEGRLWAYRSLELPFNVFDFTVSRHRDGPDWMLSGFRGFLLGDCWSGFQKIELRSDARIQRAAGAAGASYWAFKSPERFAAVALMAGGEIPRDAKSPSEAVFWQFLNRDDEDYRLQSGLHFVAAANALGSRAYLTVFPTKGHNVWNRAFLGEHQLQQWLLAMSKYDPPHVNVPHGRYTRRLTKDDVQGYQPAGDPIGVKLRRLADGLYSVVGAFVLIGVFGLFLHSSSHA